ncbi:MAG: alanine racemase [Spirochaetes bacterium GWF1_51_8]|nr:MAG: alanine racemase [Spirochaetes bacterium GWF1_51_8]
MFLNKSHRPVWAEINIDAIRSNLIYIKSKLSQDINIMGVVKADAYGHGAITVSQELLKLGVEYLAVSNIDEAIELRNAGLSSPLLLFGPVETPEFGKLIQFNVFPSVFSVDYARELSESYRYRGVFPKVHIKIDSGMGRLGIPVEDALLDIEQISKIEGMIIDGIYSHYPSADEDIPYSEQQTLHFTKLIADIRRLGIKVKHFHIANSAGIQNLPASCGEPYTMVRPGLSLYGYSTQKNPDIQNSMSLKGRITAINKMKKGATVSYLRTYTVKESNEQIAVLPLGYADGIPTILSNKLKVKIKNKLYPVVGRICMDFMMISLGQNPEKIQVGDEVTVFGEGAASVEYFGKLCHKIPYEVTCGITKRVPRIYTRKEDERKTIE